MDFLYGEAFTESSPEAYERLILDVLLGDATLFPRNAEVEASWRVIDPLEEFWAGSDAAAVPGRRVGAEGRRRDARPRRPKLAAAVSTRRCRDRSTTLLHGPRMTTLWDTTGTAVVKALAAERRTGGGVTCGLALTWSSSSTRRTPRGRGGGSDAAAQAPDAGARRGPRHDRRAGARGWTPRC